MAKQIQCPHFYSISGIQVGCWLGRFPVDCYHCDCPDKKWIEITTTTNTGGIVYGK